MSTECPTAETKCPPVDTECPAVATQCPSECTQCPEQATRCRPVETQCPAVETRCPAVETHCPPGQGTYTLGYWKNHGCLWPVDEITIGGVTYSKFRAMCILWTSPEGDATYILAHQLIAAKLNVANGADGSAVADAIRDADAWLVEHPLGSNPCDPARQAGINLSETLTDYNEGRIGPGHAE